MGLYGLTICMHLQVHVHVGTYCMYAYVYTCMLYVCIHHVKDVRQ